MHRIKPEILKHARELRRPLTPAEQILWHHMRNAQLKGIKVRRQHPIGNFIVDFYFAQYKLIIEIDGDSHAAQIDYDRIRTSWLENEGYRILRYTNRDVMDHPVAVLEDILDYFKKT
jgi:very-short-patch-repair endonuclease